MVKLQILSFKVLLLWSLSLRFFRTVIAKYFNRFWCVWEVKTLSRIMIFFSETICFFFVFKQREVWNADFCICGLIFYYIFVFIY